LRDIIRADLQAKLTMILSQTGVRINEDHPIFSALGDGTHRANRGTGRLFTMAAGQGQGSHRYVGENSFLYSCDPPPIDLYILNIMPVPACYVTGMATDAP